jgi:pimeloyl-ACP methyl ester carboxylesterase
MYRDGYLNEVSPKLHYVDRGHGGATTLVLLHGLQDCAANWDGAAERLADRYRVVALDMRGHGDSDASPNEAYALADYSIDIGRLLDGLGLERVVLVGHSSGGVAATAYAAGNPDRIAALVVVDSDIAGTTDGVPEHAAATGWGSLAEVVDYLGAMQPYATAAAIERQAVHLAVQLPEGRWALRADPAVLGAHVRANLHPEWSRLRCPALVLRGRASTVLTHEAAVGLREALPGARIAELEGAGHWPHQEIPGAFDATLCWFLEGAL